MKRKWSPFDDIFVTGCRNPVNMPVPTVSVIKRVPVASITRYSNCTSISASIPYLNSTDPVQFRDSARTRPVQERYRQWYWTGTKTVTFLCWSHQPRFRFSKNVPCFLSIYIDYFLNFVKHHGRFSVFLYVPKPLKCVKMNNYTFLSAMI